MPILEYPNMIKPQKIKLGTLSSLQEKTAVCGTVLAVPMKTKDKAASQENFQGFYTTDHATT